MNIKHKQKTMNIVKMFIVLALLMTFSGCRELSDMLDPGKNVSKKDLPVKNREKPNLSFENTTEIDVDPDSDELTEVPPSEVALIGDDSNGTSATDDNPNETSATDDNSSSTTEENTDEDNTDNEQPEVSESENPQSDTLKDAEIMSKGLWKLDDEMAREMELNPPATFVFDTPKKSGRGYGGELQISSHGTAQPEIAKYTITSKNKMTIVSEDGTYNATYKISNDGKNLQITFDSGETLNLTEY